VVVVVRGRRMKGRGKGRSEGEGRGGEYLQWLDALLRYFWLSGAVGIRVGQGIRVMGCDEMGLCSRRGMGDGWGFLGVGNEVCPWYTAFGCSSSGIAALYVCSAFWIPHSCALIDPGCSTHHTSS